MSPSTPVEAHRWAQCRRCNHYRLEHTPNGRRCEHVDPAVPNPSPMDRCGCAGFDPLTRKVDP